MIINILKCHGSGNDFILIDEYSNNYNFTVEQKALIAKILCNRSKSIGADGILYFTKSEKADCGMRIFNADGSEAEMCGNGIRCLGRYGIELLKKDSVTVETLKEVLTVSKLPELFDKVKTFGVIIKPVDFAAISLPMIYDKVQLSNEVIECLSTNLKFTAVSLPNPHIVTIVDEIDEDYIKNLGEKANNDKSIFPKGVNLNFVKPLGENTIYVQTYERGVGLTNACGTGMSASSLVSCLLGINKIGSEIRVFNRGGMVKCLPQLNDGIYTIKLMGNATYEFDGTVNLELDMKEKTVLQKKNEYTEDVKNYKKLAEYAQSINEAMF